MKIIDAHAHIFEHMHGFGWRGEMRALGDGSGVWANGERMRIIPEEYGGSSFTAEMLLELMDRHGIERAVLLQGSLYGFANDYVSETIRKYPGRLTGAGSYDPYCLGSKAILNRLTGELQYRIIKLEFSSYGGFMGYHDDFRIDSPMMEPLWEKAVTQGLVIVLDMGSANARSFQVERIADLAGRMPDVRFVITHLGAPRLEDEESLRRMLSLFAPCSNLSFDLSALLWNTLPERAPYPTAAKYLTMAREAVGSKRLLWGTDTPCVLTKFSFEELMSFFVDCGVFTEEELEDVFYNNALRIYFQ